jgi:predicted DsbA family dithiol-disulfide isomerase
LGDAFHHATFLAYFERGENIAQQAVLLKLCESVGLDPDMAKKVLDQRTYRQAVDADWDRSREMGIRAVPTFVLSDQRLVGAQPHEALEKMVLAAGVGRRY